MEELILIYSYGYIYVRAPLQLSHCGVGGVGLRGCWQVGGPESFRFGSGCPFPRHQAGDKKSGRLAKPKILAWRKLLKLLLPPRKGTISR